MVWISSEMKLFESIIMPIFESFVMSLLVNFWMFIKDLFKKIFSQTSFHVSFTSTYHLNMVFLGGSDNKESACNAEDSGFIPGLEKSPGEGNGYPLQYSCLGNPMDREAWQAMPSMGSQRVRHDLANKPPPSLKYLLSLKFHHLFLLLHQWMCNS